MAVVSIVDHERIWFLGVHGFDGGRDISHDEGLCAAAIASDEPYVVSDAVADTSAAGRRFVREHNVRFYACTPIVTSDGYRVGAVGVMDTVGHPWDQHQLGVLQELAAIVMVQLESRRSALDAQRTEQRLREMAEFARDDAWRDRDNAQAARDEARRDRDYARLDRTSVQRALNDAQRGRDDARMDRDHAVSDRDAAEHERDAIEEYATVLQQTLLPPSLPVIAGLSLAAHYHPASVRDVGGDFYDVFALADGRWAFFIGDVEGHGVHAAVATSLIRYTLRAAALHHDDPTQALAELNDVLLRELEPRRFCTVLYGTLEARGDDQGFQVTIATGGHPPALLLDPANGQVESVRSPGGMLVGIFAEATFESCTVALRPGQTLLFYTDGIIESRRVEPPFGEENLAAFAIERANLGAAGLIDELATMVPKLSPDDDVAVLAFSAG